MACPRVAETADVVVIGGGQSGLAAGYFLRRTGLTFIILDDGPGPGGAWPHGWDSLTLFSPAEYSGLPGWPMPAPAGGGYPGRDAVVAYLAAYEQRYALPIRRPIRALALHREGEGLRVATDGGDWVTRAVISATGTWRHPFIPDLPGRERFRGRQIHSGQYRRPEDFAGQSVLVVGGGNSGAQIMAELSLAARPVWVTEREPNFLPDDVDGRVLFQRSTARFLAARDGLPSPSGQGSLGDIVMVPPVRAARARQALSSRRPFARLTPEGAAWTDGSAIAADAIIWCTGFRPALSHLRPLLDADEFCNPPVSESGEAAHQLWLLGYGDWTGHASATLAGVTRAARVAVAAATTHATKTSPDITNQFQ